MRRLLILLLVLGAIGGGVYWWTHLRVPSAPPVAQGGRSGRPMGGPADIIPVLVAPAGRQDVPIYLEGLGTVQASATVTVRAMVDGPLLEVRFREGQDVRAGDVLARIDPRTYQAALDQAIAKKKQDEAQLANARLDAARYAKLASTNFISAQQADTARAQVAQLEAQVQSDQAQIDSARTQLSYTTITAPIEGRVGFRQVDAGNIVRAGDQTGLAVITTLRPILVQFTLPQQALAQVAAAMAEGPAEVLAVPQDTAPVPTRPVLDRGVLTVLDNQVDAATGTIRLRARFPNERLALWPGAFVTARLKVETLRDTTVVPPVAVQRGPQGPYVYVANANDTASRRLVKVGHEDMLLAVVTEGLAPGEQVVVDGASRLTDGAKISIVRPSGAEPPASQPRRGPPETASRRAPGAT
ncbi:multidrug efflux pump membrane fusion protein MdtA [Rhodovastum atsumiense]|uniref:Efflux RND transporter periplasmic adaptor subunit n=1 Tax=Rhodovastum atsumiense TaxID=504468 RepID=A0A5M6IXV7_9PROT|nr:efflux RND transporter periplasmic adaptor subunit [Rhodovastum atsumiense]KAA5613122.1 efflux RND transporter periplasmic adaptor subunit [Rhodovastum atsumiense]CAH2600005.1 multidrug efflux pump membrane fusion protein MdtA [Rhodovastum atsumiense]